MEKSSKDYFIIMSFSPGKAGCLAHMLYLRDRLTDVIR